ncbi:hypothetical protein SDC9_66689 [bioreactor metagenome]|uniref:Uncharacterized protein n=1 Tax=bioreactor metagenome TaxID=1076179 RepID=A0A644XVM5_9ZZZZ
MLSIHALPLHEARIITGDGAGFGKPAVADDLKRVAGKQGGDDLLIGLQLVKGCLQICIFIGSVLEFDNHHWQSVDE